MFTTKKKVESEARKPGNRLLRLFRSNDVSSGSLVSLESTDQEDACNEDLKTVRNALLEADYQSAKALLAFQRTKARAY